MLPPHSQFPPMDATLSTTLWNIKGSYLAHNRKHPTRISTHPSRSLSRDADALSDEEAEHEQATLEVRNWGSSYLLALGKMTTREDEMEQKHEDEPSPAPAPQSQHPHVGAAAQAAGVNVGGENSDNERDLDADISDADQADEDEGEVDSASDDNRSDITEI